MNQPSNRRLLQRRWVYRTLREVWLEDEQVVEKRFCIIPGAGMGVPCGSASIARWSNWLACPCRAAWAGTGKWTPEGRSIFCAKPFPGPPLHTVTPSDARDMGAKLLCAFHGSGRGQQRSHPGQLHPYPDGILACVDFGRSRTFHWRSPYFFFYVGKELARLHRTGLKLCPELWTVVPGRLSRLLRHFTGAAPGDSGQLSLLAVERPAPP
jgi:hypothetical protein